MPCALVLIIEGFTFFLHLLEIVHPKFILINRAYRSGNQHEVVVKISNPAVRGTELESLFCHLLETLENPLNFLKPQIPQL